MRHQQQPVAPEPTTDLSPTMILLQSLSQVNPQLLMGVVTLGAMFIGALALNVLMCAVLVYRRKQQGTQQVAPAPPPPPIQYIVQGTPPTTKAMQSMPSKPMSNASDEDGATPPLSAQANKGSTLRRTPSSAKFSVDFSAQAVDDQGVPLLASQVPSMKEAIQLHEARNSYIKSKTPQELLADLKAGNTRFWTGVASRPDFTPAERRALIKGQVPKVAVLGCADSRVPIEIVLDQGLGDVFVTRNAGNLYGEKVGGTIDYAIHHLGIKLVVILGHQGCGAVKAARLPREAINKESPRLSAMLNDMKDGLEYCSETLDQIQDPNARDREAVIANAQAQVKKLSADPGLKKKIRKGELLVIAAFYEITSGIVDFIEEQS